MISFADTRNENEEKIKSRFTINLLVLIIDLNDCYVFRQKIL